VVGDASDAASSSTDFEVDLSGRVLTMRTWSRYVDIRFNMIGFEGDEEGSGIESKDGPSCLAFISWHILGCISERAVSAGSNYKELDKDC